MNEIVKETRSICKDIYESLKAKHAELKSAGASTRILNDVVADINTVIALRNSVTEANAEAKRDEAIRLRETLDTKYDLTLREVPELEETETTERVEETRTEETEVGESKGVGAGVVCLGLVGTVLLAGAAYHTGVEARRVRSTVPTTEIVQEAEETPRVITRASEEQPTQAPERVQPTTPPERQEPTKAPVVEQTAAPTEAPTVAPTEAPTVAPTEVPTVAPTEAPVLVLGEYGTFFDINDVEQVNARATYIYNNYFANNESLTAQQRQLITVENIADVIRVMNGELPLNREFDGSTLNDVTIVLCEAVINVGSNVDDHYTYFPSYLLFVDGTPEQEFVKAYAPIYEKLVYALNNHDDEQVQDAIACLGFKFWNEWYLMGMDGTSINPHDLNTAQKYLMFISTIEPYNTTAREWHLSEQKPVCIEACIDYNTGEKSTVSVNDLVVALETGAWNTGAKLGNMDVEPVCWCAEYYEALNNHLGWKYDHRNTLNLNNN